MQKSKLLYIITQGHWGGAQKYIFDLAENAASDFEITIAIGEPDYKPDLQKKLKEIGLYYVQLKHLVRPISPIHDLLTIFELKKLYKKINPDIIHLNSSKAGILGSIAACGLQSKTYKLIYTAHGWVFNEPMAKWKKKSYIFLEKITAKIKNKIIVLSIREKQIALTALHIPEQKLAIIPVGVDAPKNPLSKQEARAKLTQTNGTLSGAQLSAKYLIGTIANFYPIKNLDNLIRAVAKIKTLQHGLGQEKNNFAVILIGDGDERKLLENLIIKSNLQNTVYLTGFLENAGQFLPAFDLFVLPSRKEGLPYTLIEAKINKIPIIATNVGSISDLIENKKTGLLINPENEEDLRDAILYALAHREKMKKMAEIGQNNLPKYSKENTIKQTISLYRSILR